MSELSDPEVTSVFSLTPDQGTELVADGVADVLGELASEFTEEAAHGGDDATGLTAAAAVLNDRVAESLIAQPDA